YRPNSNLPLHDALPISPALHLQNREAITGKIKTFASARNEAEVREDETAQGSVSGIFGELDLVLRLEIAKAYGSIKDHGHFRPAADDLGSLYDVELIVNFAHHLLQHVLQGNQTQDAPKFVHDHGQA